MKPVEPPAPRGEPTPDQGIGARFLWALAFTALAVLANVYAPKLFGGHSLVLGAVFYWLAPRFTGNVPALLVLAGATVTLILKWAQPFSGLLMALECLAVGFAWRRGRNPILADLIFWLLVGTPVSWLLYRHVYPIPQPSFDQALWVQPINGLLAAWVAYLVQDQLPSRRAARGTGSEPDFRTVLVRRYIAFGTFPVVIVTLLVVSNIEERTVADAKNNANAAASHLAANIERSVGNAQTGLQTIARNHGKTAWREDPAELQGVLERVQDRSRLFDRIFAVDSEGRIVAAAPRARDQAVRGWDIADREYIRETVRARKARISGIFRDPALGSDPLVAMSLPMLDAQGRHAGVVVGFMPIDRIEEFLVRAAEGTGERALLTDRGLRVVAQTGFRVLKRENLTGTPLGRVVSAGEKSPRRVTVERDGERVSVLSTNVLLPLLGWTLTVERDWREILAPVMTAYAWGLLIAVLTVLVAALFATWSLRDFLRAWRDLIRFSREAPVRPELLESTARLRLPHEFNELILNLSRMADRLTEERRNREQLLVQLETRVRERTAELEQAALLARSADRAKGAFLSTVTHELRTPLTAIVTAVRLLRMGNSPRTDVESRTLATLENASHALMAVISDVLDYSRLEAGAVRPEAGDFLPAVLLTEVASIMEPEARRKGLELLPGHSLPADRVWRSDVRRVKQVLLNLVGNAVKFTPAGQIEITAWTTEDPRRLWFAVSDAGPGIPPDRLQRIFEPFFQLETNQVHPQAGTGLGLSISRRLVELMGGKIHAVDTGGRGARFEFWLPEEPPPPPPRTHTSGQYDQVVVKRNSRGVTRS